MKKVALFLFLSVCFAQQSCSSDSVGTEPEENPQDILFKDDFNFFDEKVWTKETHEPGWTNQELQAYDAAHVSVGKDGDNLLRQDQFKRKKEFQVSQDRSKHQASQD